MLPLVAERLLRLGLALLALVDHQAEALAVVGRHQEVAGQAVTFRRDLLTQPDELGEVGRERFGLPAHLRQHGAEHHGGTHRLQSVLGADDERRRYLSSHALQGGEHLGDHVVPLLERCPQRPLAVVELRQALLSVGDALFHAADAGHGVDDLLVELAAVVTDRLDLAFELGLVIERLLLLGAHRLEFLIALFDRGALLVVLRRRVAARRGLCHGCDQPERQHPQHRQGHGAQRGSGTRHGEYQSVLGHDSEVACAGPDPGTRQLWIDYAPPTIRSK